ncbi:MAG: bifunctional tRNA (5-methylaminomethyl-2-thiouridine)(34)-methyltransferase MnmD/FAD-dependent 5-carboxymethylaminomethyl-2-thiouridine(34) oxidoreductase MnmC [Campylobacteraceae bacterium]|nr:bifunctional tRNA (5-methylaminomethyl-2-thiouridine)(34)-methyltransferase MnmD/FAD-dependent 5-carboxymethylaminomethyl-2-thiouridine(34) oxidoreductase MnmC [Campylobacteraceae bacterium]
MEVSFKESILYNHEFDDVYFSKVSPLEESKFVFESAVDEIWDRQSYFIVAEAGFGAGLNFLNLADKFKKSEKFLHFVSIEKNPLPKKVLREFYKNLGAFEGSSKKLIKKLKNLTVGLNRIYFSKNIILDLYIGDIKEALVNLDFEADVWFMDGFAPSKNPDMWDLETIQGIASLSRAGTIIATYSSTKAFHKNLQESGFEVEILEGYGTKREMTRAVLTTKFEDVKKEIFYSRPKFKNRPKKVLVIGAGIAGLVTALKLQKAGLEVVVAEKNSKVATNGSGNLIGALLPLITQKGVLLGEMHESAFNLAVKFYKKHAKKHSNFSGAKVFAHDEKLAQRYQNSNFTLEDDTPYPSVFIKNGATIRPKKLCQKLAKKLNVLLGYEFMSFTKVDSGYEVAFKNGEMIATDAIVFAMGSYSEELFNSGLEPRLSLDESMQISSVRGQVTWIKPQIKTEFSLSAKGYICPEVEGIQLIGATYDRKDYAMEPRFIDDVKNLESIEEFLGGKKAKIVGSKVGFRSYSGDRFPLIGALHDEKWFRENYKDVFWSKNSSLYPKHLEHVYINTAHGARGLGTAIMGAEILTDMILNRPFCVSKDILDALNPARFLVRKLKKGLV